MYKINQILFLSLFSLLFYSCKGQLNEIDSCKKKFKEARELAYSNPERQSALDSSLNLVNNCMQCASIRQEVVDFKITLLANMKNYPAAINFIDSLQESDFAFGYKKNLMHKGLQALSYASQNDTIKQKLMYKEIVSDVEQYIKNHKISSREFKEIYTDLFTIKRNYLDDNQIDREIEELKKMYPEQKTFFEFFRK